MRKRRAGNFVVQQHSSRAGRCAKIVRTGTKTTALQACLSALTIPLLQRYAGDGAMIPHTVEHPYIHFNGNSGYARRGDSVALFADRIDNLNSSGVSSSDLALQLWACQAPYHGGPLTGWKLAELPLGALQANHYLAPVDSDARVSFPEAGDYAIVLAIAEWDGEGFNRVHDYHNYPNRDLFLHPRFDGPVGYRCLDTGRIAVEVGRIYSPRDPNNTSGTLCLELWALPEPYSGGAFTGHALAAVTLGSLAGGASWQDCAYDLEMTPPPAGTYTLTLMLREWVGNGYATRDHSNFANPVTFPLVTAPPRASETVGADAPGDQAAGPAHSSQPADEADAVGRAAAAGHPADSLASQASQLNRAAPQNENLSRPGTPDKLIGLARRLFETLKRHW